MKNKITPQEMRLEYEAFFKSPRSAPSTQLSDLVHRSVNADLNPPAFKVFCKLFVIHFISGAVTLFFCPQLGVTLHGQSSFLLDLFVAFGEYGCMVACGALFLGATGFVAALLLRSPEIRVIKRSRTLQWFLLSFLSLGFFLSVRESENSIAFGLVVAWIGGALFGGFFTFRVGWLFRNRVKAYLLSQAQ